jgi:hypothetical protein
VLSIQRIVLEDFQILLKEYFCLELSRFRLPVKSLATIVSFLELSQEKVEESYEQEIVDFLHSPAFLNIVNSGG